MNDFVVMAGSFALVVRAEVVPLPDALGSGGLGTGVNGIFRGRPLPRLTMTAISIFPTVNAKVVVTLSL